MQGILETDLTANNILNLLEVAKILRIWLRSFVNLNPGTKNCLLLFQIALWHDVKIYHFRFGLRKNMLAKIKKKANKDTRCYLEEKYNGTLTFREKSRTLLNTKRFIAYM